MTQTSRANLENDTFTLGGLHMDDFGWASKEYQESGYVLIGFFMEVDGYHWKAVYVKAEDLDEALRSSE